MNRLVAAIVLAQALISAVVYKSGLLEHTFWFRGIKRYS